MNPVFITASGWEVWSVTVEGKPTVTLRAISPDRSIVVTRKGVKPEEVESFDPEEAWRNVLHNRGVSV